MLKARALVSCLALLTTLLISAPLAKADPAPGPGAVSRLVAGALPAGVVPDGTCRARVTATGGGGASSPTAAGFGGRGGSGAVISATFVVIPGQSYGGSVGGGGTVPNGGSGNGAVGFGGAGGTIVNNHRGGGGGGRTSVVLAGVTVVIAGGGGGGGAAHQVGPSGNGGGAGFAGIGAGVAVVGTNGQVGVDGANTANGGQGGQVGAGGAGGTNTGSAARNGFVGGGIGVGTGGNGGVDPNYDSAGGGGGGYTGGGGGASTVNQNVTGAGGGGGSSWVNATSPVVSATAPTSVTGAAGTASPAAAGPGAVGSIVIDWLPCLYDLQLVKSVAPSPVNPGGTATWTVSVTNNGPDPMTRGDTIDLTDTVPGPPTIVASISTSGGASTNMTRPAVTCTGVTVGLPMPAATNCSRAYSGAPGTPGGAPAGGTRGLDPAEILTITYTQAIPLATPCGTVYSNTATVRDRPSQTAGADITGVTVLDNVNASVTVACQADLAVTKTDGVASVVAGTSTTYTITVTNNGPASVPAGVVLSDTIPAGTNGSESEANCAIAAGVFTCTTTAAIASGGSVSYQLTLAIPSGYAPATVANTAAISSSPLSDPTPGNNSATDTDNVTRSADLAITKIDSADPVNPGQAFTYTLTVTNNGPSDASNLTVSDTVPAQFTVTGVSSGAGSCGNVGNVVTCTRATLANAASWAITVNVTANASTPAGTYLNTAAVSATEADPVPGNNSGPQNTTVNAFGDLAITKNDGVASVVAGTSTTYTITVTNNGPSTVPAGVVISDSIPANTIGSELEANCAIAAGVFTCTTAAAIPSGGSVSFQLTLAVSAGYPLPNLANTVSITSSPIPDPFGANDSATDTDTVTGSADLSITKDDGVASVVAGTSTTYTITVTNNGPSTVPAGVVIADAIPVNTIGSELEANCAIAAGVFTCTTTASLAPSASVSFQLTLAVDPNYPAATLVNTATITSSPYPDPVPGNNSATDTDTVTTSADLSITKSDGVASVIAGTSTTYTITLTNNGPSTVPAGVVISDPIPAGTNGSESEADCAISAGVFVCTTTVVLAPSASVSYQLTLALPANYAAPTLANTATITSSPVADPVPGNDSATDTDTVTTSADLSITKTDSADPVDPGNSFFYTLTVVNNGPSDASGLTVTDSVPAGFTITSVTSGSGSCGFIVNLATCTLASLPLSGTWTITINVDVDPATGGGLYTDTATVTATTSDPVPGNNSDTEGTVVTPAGDLAAHQDRRGRLGDRRHLHHLHDHAYEPRTFERPGRGRDLRRDPGQHHRLGAQRPTARSPPGCSPAPRPRSWRLLPRSPTSSRSPWTRTTPRPPSRTPSLSRPPRSPIRSGPTTLPPTPTRSPARPTCRSPRTTGWPRWSPAPPPPTRSR